MATYYVRNDGSEGTWSSATGPESNAANCMSLSTHNAAAALFSPDDEIIISGLPVEDGGVFRGTLTIGSSGTSGHTIKYTGSNDPIFDGSIWVIGPWNDNGSNVWSIALTTDPTYLYIDGNFGDEKANTGEFADEYDWYWASNVLYLRSTSDPWSLYDSINAVHTSYGINNSGNSFLEFSYLETQNQASIGFLNHDCNDITVHHCAVHDVGYGRPSDAGGGHGLVFNGSSNSHAYNNEIYRIHWDALCAWGLLPTVSASSGYLFEDNDCHHNEHNGIDIHTQGYGATISDITIRRNLVRDSPTGNGIYGMCEYYSPDVNQISDVKIYDNIVHSNYIMGIYLARVNANDIPITGAAVYNNTIVNNGSIGLLAVVVDSDFQNNIIQNNNTRVTLREVQIDDEDGTANTFDYNLIFNDISGLSTVVVWNDGYYSYANFVSTTEENENGLNEDADFTDENGGNYTLSSESPCIGVANNLGSPYNIGVLPGASWPDSVTTGNRDNY